tara:strand:- start:2282 stop:2722 length:441 start_codon:yes stop_codon:yes gene_type:complete
LKNINWPIKTELPIQWGEMDAFNHVNNVVYIRWFETSRIELFRKMWGDDDVNLQEILKGDGVGPILANFNINYNSPLFYPDTAFVFTKISAIGNSSFGVDHILKSKNNGDKVIAEANSTVVMFNFSKNVTSKLSFDQKETLKKFMI